MLFRSFPSHDISHQNLSPAYLVNTGDGPDPDANYVILNRGKRHDYFTSCLPWPQKGPSVVLPLGSSADVKWRNAPGNTPTMRYTAGGIAPAGALSALAGGGIQSAGAPGAAIGLDPSGTLYTELYCFRSYGYADFSQDRKSTRLNSSHSAKSRMPSSA